MRNWALVWTALMAGMVSAASEQLTQDAMYRNAALIYQERCVLCHGKQGFGLGLLPTSVKNYPNTNLHKLRHGDSLEDIKKNIALGAKLSKIDDKMPPWDEELTVEQINALAKYVKLLVEESTKAYSYQKDLTNKQSVSDAAGKNAYKRYCVQCHGERGRGDGRMAKIIKKPPPANLAASLMPDAYLKIIIKRGGEAIGRSPQMPPWGSELTEQQVDSIIRYINILRKDTLKPHEKRQ
ncbi:c-type cytochrome [Pleionea sp. CnH1-48]|uniref:c-type cytochrome n=1 Tax=Pleionea sp. CnH1-48 TaxID=2954494 RepID=UPI002096F0D6|nr:c-type cytochrome [Pleionea sp. CnH1-48]MCO7223654.1 cytochrome c [Pleionea sp. CnH1-48]